MEDHHLRTKHTTDPDRTLASRAASERLWVGADTNVHCRLLEWIHPSQLPVCMGGQMECELDQILPAMDRRLGYS